MICSVGCRWAVAACFRHRVVSRCRYYRGPHAAHTPTDLTHAIDPTYTFEIHGGIGQKSYVPIVVFCCEGVALERLPAAAGADSISLDLSTCILTPRPDVVASVALTPPTTGCQSALELCGVEGDKQVPPRRMRHRSPCSRALLPVTLRFVLQTKCLLFFMSLDGAQKFIESCESLLYTAMELNRYRKVVYLPNASEAQDTSVIKNRYLEMAELEQVPLLILHEDSGGECLQYTAKFVKKSLWLEPARCDASCSPAAREEPNIVVPLKGRAVSFSDDNNTDLQLAHNRKAIVLRFANDVDRDAFAYMCGRRCSSAPALLPNVTRRRFLSNTKVTEPSDFRLTRSFPSLALPTVMPDESRRNGDCALPQGGHAASADEEATVSESPSSGDAEEMPKPRGRKTSVIAMHKQGWLCVAPAPCPCALSAVCAVLWRALV